MMNRLNSVVIKLWLTIILIVTTVLIFLSIALITFMQYYFTQDTEDAIKEDAKRISSLVEESHNKSEAIKYSQTLIENPGGLMIINNKHNHRTKALSETKVKMLNEITKYNDFDDVFDKGKSITKNVTINDKGNSKSYMLVGYPTKAQKNSNSNYSGVFIYKDLKSIEDTNNAITIITTITAVIFLIVTTIFAFFLSTRITKPLRHLRDQAQRLAAGDYTNKTTVATNDEIGQLSRTFNQMSTEIEEHIDALSTSTNIRDSLINSMVEGVLGINENREILLSNKMAKDITLNMDDMTKNALEQQIEDTFISQQTEIRDLEMNTRFYVVITSYIDKIQQGGKSGIVVTIRDMTNEHNLDQMKKDFIANVSHELRTPISLLQGYTESIVDGIVTEPEEIRDSLAIVLDESKRLNRLVNELLNVARMDAEGLTVVKEIQPIAILLDKMKVKYRQQSIDLGLTMTFDYCNDKLWDYDMDRMEQVLTNLIDNASRYTKSGDSITITCDSENDKDVLYISDTGTGIAPEHLQQVFERFYKVDAARTRGKQGTGLGLFICKMIIEEHGGSIDVESEWGKGTTFIIKLPKAHS
ncbi:HAMP domain-containing protein [Staphylococcus simiae]|uniref:ATP-binding protein n=1 Tax=Staphylococcus simiae TaxID=308354 RepID=UPI001A97D266|nr:ATP-binding protein [Staphylococcus simiae]MBO1197889.1 HAMP domain-containing protein [Staphylococcus simiae]MBO1200080.1 HAMP domain-containing protein [Staphylococcus simiae]MBO1202353.1 HAMP domain-containing protein [Staphylococcus simiae]MBO1209880.1 HAMP domain-containing protein [Staphylococcus simiae]MBO1228497.1 HAMP domain-containing protein [Staphylococcus simiae]